MTVLKGLSVFVFLAAMLFVTACSGGLVLPTPKGYSQLCERYVNADSQVLIKSWGYPGRTFQTKDGKQVYVYVETRDEYTLNPLAHSALIEYPPRMDPRKALPEAQAKHVYGQPVDSMDYCMTYFEVGKDNKIQQVYWKGDCRSQEALDARVFEDKVNTQKTGANESK